MSSIFGTNNFLFSGIRNFKDALAKGTNEFSEFGTVLSSKLKQAATVVGLANTLNDVENSEGRRKRVRLVQLYKAYLLWSVTLYRVRITETGQGACPCCDGSPRQIACLAHAANIVPQSSIK